MVSFGCVLQARFVRRLFLFVSNLSRNCKQEGVIDCRLEMVTPGVEICFMSRKERPSALYRQ